MKDVIGNTAGKVWNLLKEKEEIEISRVPKILKEKTLIVYQSMGWLAREDKIGYRTEGDKTYVSLTDFE
ncbi:MAG: winged helix-turn-helix domain-containing protein [Thermodesulfobacteriota bacterium]|nr:winged helix-turn-helix domain-containing protein [Thermodesulfobacteriota bacterium]